MNLNKKLLFILINLSLIFYNILSCINFFKYFQIVEIKIKDN